MFVFDENKNKIEYDVDTGTLELKQGQKINASSKVIKTLIKIANYLSTEESRKTFVKFKKYGYIVELYETIEDNPEPVELTKTEDEIIGLFEGIELRDVISLLNILVDIDYSILKRFILNLMAYIVKSMSPAELEKYFESCKIADDEEVPDYFV